MDYVALPSRQTLTFVMSLKVLWGLPVRIMHGGFRVMMRC
jgi:hypothetical protein